MKTLSLLILFSLIFVQFSTRAQLTFTIINSSNSYSITCKTPTVNLTATSTYSAAVSYTWISPQLVSVTANSLSLSNPGTYTVSANSGNVNTSQTIAIGINTVAPSLSITSTSSVITCTNFTASLLGLCNAPSFNYTWTVPGPYNDIYGQNPTLAATMGVFKFIAKDLTNGCISTATIYIYDNRTYFVMTTPEPFLVTCPDGTVTISPLISQSTNSISFSWISPPGANVSGANTVSLTTNAPGPYTVVATNTANGCSTARLIYVYACVGISENNFDKIFYIFPNPIKDKLHFEFDNTLVFENLQLKISNTSGQIVYLKNKADLSEELDISFLKTGLYFLKLETDEGYKIFKVVKE